MNAFVILYFLTLIIVLSTDAAKMKVMSADQFRKMILNKKQVFKNKQSLVSGEYTGFRGSGVCIKL